MFNIRIHYKLSPLSVQFFRLTVTRVCSLPFAPLILNIQCHRPGNCDAAAEYRRGPPVKNEHHLSPDCLILRCNQYVMGLPGKYSIWKSGPFITS